MKCRDLKVVNLNITEDHYEYKALFRLCTDDKCLDIDLAEISSDGKLLEEIKNTFNLEETTEEIKEIIMEKVMEASKLESRNVQGEDCCKSDVDKKTSRDIDSLNRS
ncbi:hypothetical protein [Acetivibrio saccincola]|jgi:hypothetical protein|uniref:Uncharacterized protein n=1 Tax=Acetivibrio saccincola TaxID=1677857 RepID=A0A2K9EGB5_9FIRM|nr:hypothetical protein [Acetivibrio saccincola]AUG56953.1 hypothetical protein HVS_05100 [Acetivibrio saccincola]NLW25944.1 hypothetical protein [Acetivibrio saccincola]PQQ66976.1 hypothetical protein B9R14_09655 [Acetivibrio saccincola]HQD29305.1 hypothetical protein [Acetivibrio saccincola]